MNSLKFYYDQIAPRGSTLYYSLLHVNEPAKSALLSLNAFYQTLMSIGEKNITPEIGLKKLNWWQGELNRAYNGTAEHPLGKSLQLIFRQHDLPKELFQALITGVESLITPAPLHTFDDFIKISHQTRSLLFMLSSYLVGASHQKELLFARDMGVVQLIIDQIRHLPHALQHQYWLLPLDDLEQSNLNFDKILKLKKENFPALTNYLRLQIKRANQIFQENLPNYSKKQKPILNQIKIGLKILNKLNKKDFSPELLDISPIAKFFVTL